MLKKSVILILVLILLVGCKQQPQIYQINQIDTNNINEKTLPQEISETETNNEIINKETIASINNKEEENDTSITQKFKTDIENFAVKVNTNIEIPEFLNEEQKETFDKATKIYEYIDLNTLPINSESYIENNGIRYYEVLENEFYNNDKEFYNDVKKYFYGELQRFIIDKNTYIMNNNKLYTLDINREKNPYFISVEYNTNNIPQNKNTNILEFTAVVSYYESGIITENKIIFQMEYIENNWKFTQYDLLY